MLKDVIRVGTRDIYPVYVGYGLLTDSSGDVPFIPSPGKVVVVTNPTVGGLWLEPLLSMTERAGARADVMTVGDGEEHKNLDTLARIYDFLAERGHDRETVLVALGGGVVGDLTGFAAATYMRGIRFVQAPTTLLAQVDASIGGKTAVDHRLGKNLIGAFHQPTAVYCDLDTLETLGPSDFRDGLSEVLKTAIIDGESFLGFLEEQLEKVLDRAPETLSEVVARCVRLKAGIVASDERDTGQRMVLNLGHTFGHALESACEYSGMSHGQAVSIGVAMAVDMAGRLGEAVPEFAARVSRLQGRLDLPQDVAAVGRQVDPDSVMERLLTDKKRRAGRLRFVVPKGPGHVSIEDDVPAEVVRRVVLDHTLTH